MRCSPANSLILGEEERAEGGGAGDEGERSASSDGPWDVSETKRGRGVGAGGQ